MGCKQFGVEIRTITGNTVAVQSFSNRAIPHPKDLGQCLDTVWVSVAGVLHASAGEIARCRTFYGAQDRFPVQSVHSKEVETQRPAFEHLSTSLFGGFG